MIRAALLAACVCLAPPTTEPDRTHWLTIPDLGFHAEIVYGGQGTIDAGHVVDVTGWCPTGTRHIAGHRTTHGAIFNALPQLEPGDTITITDHGVDSTWVLDYVDHGWDCDDIYGELVLQTSHPDGGAYIFHFTAAVT